jgi:hypothetical protein
MSRLIQLAEARAVLASQGKSPRQIGEEARLEVLNWIYRWGFSSATLIQKLLNRTAAGYAAKLTNQGWLASTRTESGVPKTYFTLSDTGLSTAERYATELLRYPEIDPYRVNQKLLRHSLIAQLSTINSISSGMTVEYLTERMLLANGIQHGEKLPDVVWKTASGISIALEIELSAKWERDLDQFILGVMRALDPEADYAPRFDRFVVVSDSPAILKRYEAAMQPRNDLRLWKKNKRQHWEVTNTTPIPDWLRERVNFHQFLHHGDSDGATD